MNIIEWLKVILLGIVEGITEWLPISSTGHMILVDEFIKLNVTADFKNVFEVVIQLGAILAVVVIYFWDLWPFHGKSKAKSKSYFANPSDNKVFAGIQNFVDNYCYLDKIIMWFKIVVSCLPAAVIGLAFNDWIEAHLMNYVIVALMLTSMVSSSSSLRITTRREHCLQQKSKRLPGKMRCISVFSSSFPSYRELPVREQPSSAVSCWDARESSHRSTRFSLPFRLCSARAF